MAFIIFYLVPTEVSKDICFAQGGTDLQPSVASDPMDPGVSRSAPSRWARRGRTDRMEDVEDREVPALQSPSESLERMAMDGPQESAQDSYETQDHVMHDETSKRF